MIFNVPKILVALAAITGVTALPTSHDESATCDFVLRPDGPYDASDLLGEFNYAIGLTLAVVVPSHIINGGNSTWVENEDGTFNVQKTDSAVGETSDSVATIMTGWLGTSLQGPTANWFVESVTCD